MVKLAVPNMKHLQTLHTTAAAAATTLQWKKKKISEWFCFFGSRLSFLHSSHRRCCFTSSLRSWELRLSCRCRTWEWRLTETSSVQTQNGPGVTHHCCCCGNGPNMALSVKDGRINRSVMKYNCWKSAFCSSFYWIITENGHIWQKSLKKITDLTSQSTTAVIHCCWDTHVVWHVWPLCHLDWSQWH